jgi:hypothetical protein
MPQAFPPDSQMFAHDQRLDWAVEFWDTPFTPLRNDIASAGIPFTLKEPRTSDGAWDVLPAIRDAAASGVEAAWDGAAADTVLTGGRLANLVGYWAGGAPGYHGAAYTKRVAYRFECYFRPTTSRDWFDPSATVTLALAAAGNGYIRVIKNGTTDVYPGGVMLTEPGFLSKDTGGLTWSTLFTLATDDKLDIYYVQDPERRAGKEWGGFVFKAIPANVLPGGAVPVKVRERNLLARELPIIGCGLMDDGASLAVINTKQTLQHILGVEVTYGLGQTAVASFRVPLVNASVTDGVGWEWVREGDDHAGFLRLRGFLDAGAGEVVPISGNGTDPWLDIKRQRLIRIKTGFRKWDEDPELYTTFTGFIDDFSGASTGEVTVSCTGLEQRLSDQFVKNYPDKISYMTYGYQRLRGTLEPVYDIPAYDNWEMEFALRDLMTRSGIDESRTRAPLRVPQADGTDIAVVM